MSTKVLKFIVLLVPVFLPTEAFWWGTSSTEAPPPPPPAMKQIPLTYFRTYTYQQPVTGSNSVHLPLLSSTDYITNYNALANTPYFNPMMPVMHMSNEIPFETKPVKPYGNFHMVRALGPLPAEATRTTTTTTEPTTSTTTTTTTTTTTPEPTTTSTTEPPTTVQLDTPTPSLPVIQSDSVVNVETSFPAFNRKAFTNHFNINYNRPVYPYPEYATGKSNSASEKIQALPNIEFVPCMCPVNMPNGGFAGNPSNSIFLAQGRTNVAAEASLEAPGDNGALNAEVKAEEENLTQDFKLVSLKEEEEVAALSQGTLR